jgi:mRNA interferase RelE/StbE
MSYRVEVSKRASKSLARFPNKIQISILEALERLEDDPFHPQLDIKALHGELKGLYRVRVSSYRIIYETDQLERVVRVRQILHRQNAYD